MRLLLAEDEKELSRALCTILEHNQYAVDAVYNGQDAYDWAVNGEYDGILLDVMMPKLDGVQVLAKLRADGIKTPVLMLTAKGETEDKIKGLDAGADDYVTKPFDMRELLARVRALTRRRDDYAPSTVSVGDLQLNKATFELTGPDGVIRLGGKEFQMMELFMSSVGRLFATERLMEKIWGYDSDAEINVVWVCVSTLRKKLAGLGSKTRITAVRGVGYRLECDK